MATAESNTLLLQQLFGAPTAELNRQFENREQLKQRNLELNRAERIGNEQADKQYKRSIDLANLQTDKALEVEDARDEREKRRFAEQEKQKIAARFQEGYPAYVKMARSLEQTPKAFSEFEATPAGLGVFLGELADLEAIAKQRNQEGHATVLMNALQIMQAGVKSDMNAIKEARKFSEQDLSFSKNIALKTLNQKRSEFPGISDEAWNKGIAALSKNNPDESVAWDFLKDPAARSTYEFAYDAGLEHARKSPERLAQIKALEARATASQAKLFEQKNITNQAAANNPTLQAKLGSFYNQDFLADVPPAPAKTSDLDALSEFRKKPAGGTPVLPASTFGSPALADQERQANQAKVDPVRQRLMDLTTSTSQLESAYPNAPKGDSSFLTKLGRTITGIAPQPGTETQGDIAAKLKLLLQRKKDTQSELDKLMSSLGGASSQAPLAPPLGMPLDANLQDNGSMPIIRTAQPAIPDWLQQFQGPDSGS